jgi:hypothetical protein
MSIDRESFRLKSVEAKYIAEQKKKLLKNPMPQYVEMPEITGDAELDSINDLNAIHAGFRARSKDESKRFQLATDSEYWVCVCFQTKDQKNEFLKKSGLISIGDKYLDGKMVANRLGIDIADADMVYNTSSKQDKKLIKLT